MKQAGRGGPGEFEARLARVAALLAPGGGAGTGAAAGGGGAAVAAGAGTAPLRLLAAVLRHQAAEAAVRSTTACAGAVAAGWEERLAAGRFPLLDLDAAAGAVADGIAPALAALEAGPGGGAVAEPLALTGRDRAGARRPERLDGAVPEPLLVAGRDLAGAPGPERLSVVEAWLDDPAAIDPRLGFWLRVTAGPVAEVARAAIRTPSRDEWTGAACPACGGPPQASVIAEESGEFMGGSPRSLVCGRCAGWWTYPRAVCPWCAEEDPRRLPGFVPDGRRVVRIDACETCRGYVKTFDLRAPGGIDVVPLVDDVATVTLDVWAHDQGFHRPLVSLAGV